MLKGFAESREALGSPQSQDVGPVQSSAIETHSERQ